MDSVKANCILCKSNDLSVESTFDSKLINNIYQESFGRDFSQFFNLESFSFFKCNDCSHLFFDPRMAGNDKFYEVLQEIRDNYYSPLRPEFLMIKNYITEKDKVLEVGAGDGDFAKVISCNSYVGLEFNDLAIKNAIAKGVTLKDESVEAHSLSNKEVYDVIVSNHVHEHVSDLYSFIEAGVKCLRKDGYYIFSVPNNDNHNTSSINHTLNLPPHHISRFTKKSFESLDIFGLELVSLESVKVSKSRKYRLGIVNNFLLKKIAKFNNWNQVAISLNSVHKATNLINKLPIKLKLVIYKFLIKDQGLNSVVVYKKL